MKKLLIALLALTVVGTTAFAADPALKVSGYVGAGAMIGYGSDIAGPGVDSVYWSYSDDYGDGAGTWGTITAEYQGETSGFKTTLGADSSGSAVLDKAYGWASPMAGLKLFAGTGYNDAFDGVDDDSNDYFGNEALSVTYSVSGLTFGAAMVLATGDGDGVGATENPSWAFGVAYAMEGLSARFSAETDDDELDNMAASVKYTGVENLTLSGGYLAVDMMDTSAAPIDNWIDFTAKYQVSDALCAQVVVYDYLEKEYFKILPRVSYKVSDMLSVYGQLGYVTEGKDKDDYPQTMLPRVRADVTFDDVSSFYAQYEYDTDAEVSAIMLQYVFSF